MRIYCFGDLHGNVYALEACLRHMDSLKPDVVYCLGDLVGWLPFGDRTLRRMRSLRLPTVAGNHDLMVAGLFTDHPRQLDRMQATAYNAGLLAHAPDDPEYLLGLPLMIEKPDHVAVHHSPFHLPEAGNAPHIGNFDYLDEAALEGALPRWKSFPQRVILSGHDHLPAIYELPGGIDAPTVANVTVHKPTTTGSVTVRLKADARYWVKGGSVGGPYRDGVPQANAVLLDDSAETITLFRIPYPWEQLLKELSENRFFSNIPTIRRYMELLKGSSG
ncbi:MAG: metallophosphoesterase [Deltaproteobacteria bacterium]|nr:metallophosphoesterase [Deltaproteobacteria bacterium]